MLLGNQEVGESNITNVYWYTLIYIGSETI